MQCESIANILFFIPWQILNLPKFVHFDVLKTCSQLLEPPRCRMFDIFNARVQIQTVCRLYQHFLFEIFQQVVNLLWHVQHCRKKDRAVTQENGMILQTSRFNVTISDRHPYSIKSTNDTSEDFQRMDLTISYRQYFIKGFFILN